MWRLQGPSFCQEKLLQHKCNPCQDHFLQCGSSRATAPIRGTNSSVGSPWASVPIKRTCSSMSSPWAAVLIRRTSSSMGCPGEKFLSEPAPAWALHGHCSCQEKSAPAWALHGHGSCQENLFENGLSIDMAPLRRTGSSMGAVPVGRTCYSVGSPQTTIALRKNLLQRGVFRARIPVRTTSSTVGCP